MIREVALLAMRRWPAPWIAGGLLLVGAVGMLVSARSIEAQRAEVAEASLRQTRAARERALAEVAAGANEEKALRWLRDAAIAASPVETVQRLRQTASGAGIEGLRVDLLESVPHGDLRLLKVRIAGSGRYRPVRRLLFELQSDGSPIGWDVLSYDGERLSLELRLLSRGTS